MWGSEGGVHFYPGWSKRGHLRFLPPSLLSIILYYPLYAKHQEKKNWNAALVLK